jgi:hypothetical protein
MKSDYRKVWRPILWAIYGFDGGEGQRVECCHCGDHLTIDQMTIEHLTPLALRGRNTIKNLLPSCMPCNTGRPCEDIAPRFVHYIQVRVEQAIASGRVLRGRKGNVWMRHPHSTKRKLAVNPMPHEAPKKRAPLVNPVIQPGLLHFILPGKPSTHPDPWEQQHEDFG